MPLPQEHRPARREGRPAHRRPTRPGRPGPRGRPGPHRIPGLRGRHLLVAVLVALVVAVSVTVFRAATRSQPAAVAPSCSVTNGAATFVLDLDQASNATTIAAVAHRLRLPDHAVTVALATALQESGLHDLPGGDRDSLGLFQQRPSQGWGTPAEILSPRYAATAFYERLAAVPGWEALAVTVAAQDVQHSGAPDAYANWAPEARVLAEALTGEVPAGLACRFLPGAGAVERASLRRAGRLELGTVDLAAGAVPSEAWQAACWLVGHAREDGIASVSYRGHRWTATAGAWTTVRPVVARVTFAGR